MRLRRGELEVERDDGSAVVAIVDEVSNLVLSIEDCRWLQHTALPAILAGAPVSGDV